MLLAAPVFYPFYAEIGMAALSFAAAGVTAVETYMFAQRQMRQVTMPATTINRLANQPQADSGGNPTPKGTLAKIIVGGLLGLQIFETLKDVFTGKKNTGENDSGLTGNKALYNSMAVPAVSQNNGVPKITAPSTSNIGTPNINQPTLQQNPYSSYNSNNLISNLQKQVAIMQQILYLQTQINQIKSSTK